MFSPIINKVLSRRSDFAHDLELLEKYIENFLLSNFQFSQLTPFLLNKGKRIRSILYFMHWASDENSDLKYQTAALIEIIHFASLLHDDVIDNNLVRRRSDSFAKSHGYKSSIVRGDLLLITAIKRFLKLHSDNDFVKTLCLRECAATAYGGALERQLHADSSFEECLRVTSLKTAPLFKLACFLGRFLSSNDFESAKAASTFGLCFGTLCQIQNDLESYSPEHYVDSEDYSQKNVTLPIIILRAFLGFDMANFLESSQDNYAVIQKLLRDGDFQHIASGRLDKIIRRVSDSLCF